ncbi:unnamed protein product, partial [Rotaria magnacalcarata]
MNTIHKTNLKRMREILLTANDEINDDIADSKNSDLAGGYDIGAAESDDNFHQ